MLLGPFEGDRLGLCVGLRCEELEKKREFFSGRYPQEDIYAHREQLTSFDGALIGAFEGDRLGLVVGCEMNDEKKKESEFFCLNSQRYTWVS